MLWLATTLAPEVKKYITGEKDIKSEMKKGQESLKKVAEKAKAYIKH